MSTQPRATKTTPNEEPKEYGDLVRDLKANNETALVTIMRLTSKTIRDVIARVLKNQYDIDEVLYQSYLQLWNSRHGLDLSRGKFLGWLIIVARRRALDRVRRVLAREAATTEYEMITKVDLDRLETERRHRSMSIGRNELEEMITIHLPPEQAESVRLTYFTGMSQREISRHLGRPLGTIKARIELGVRKLKRALEHDQKKDDRATNSRA